MENPALHPPSDLPTDPHPDPRSDPRSDQYSALHASRADSGEHATHRADSSPRRGPTDHAADTAASVLQARLRLHGSVLARSVSSSGVVGLLLVMALALMPSVPGTPMSGVAGMAAWLTLLAAALGLRVAVSRSQARDPDFATNAAIWLRRHRAASLLHGLVWASAAVLLVPSLTLQPPYPQPHPHFNIVLFAMAAIAAGGLMSLGFDRVAALLFSTAPALMLALSGLLLPGGVNPGLYWMALVLLGFAALGARRAHRAMRGSVRQQLVDTAHAQASQINNARTEHAHRRLADQHHLLTQLLQTTHQGYWFTDNQSISTDVNPAMALMLGLPREQIIGRSIFDFFSGADVERLRLEMESRRQGRPGGYEIALTRADGSTLPCMHHTTPIFDTHGARVGAVGLWTDLSRRQEADARLRTYALVVNSITDMVAVIDEQERYLLVNDAWCRATGVPREQALGGVAAQVVPSAVSPERQQAFRAAIDSGVPHTGRGNFVLASAGERIVETTYYPYAEAGLQRVAMITRDITQRRQAEEAQRDSEAELRALLAAFPGFIAAMDEGLHYTYVNDGLARVLGRPAAEIMGRTVRDVLGPERGGQVADDMRRVQDGERVVMERHYPQGLALPGAAASTAGADAPARHPGQLDVQVTHVAGPHQADGRRTFYAFGIDITARKRAEEATTAARDEAERANRAKSQFLAQMSHELRTPLNAILGFGQLLQSDRQLPLAGHQVAHVDEIMRGARHLLALINELLDLGRIEAGQLLVQPEPVPLLPLLADCLGLMQALAQEHGVRLLPVEVSGPQDGRPLAALATPTHLKQVLLNLLGNAIKYNRRGGEVAVSCGLLAAVDGQPGRVRLAVRDTGRGLSAAEQARLFQPFERLGAAQSGVEGTGIGLALTRRLVGSMGGEVGANSQPGVGSEFWVELPLADDMHGGGAGAAHGGVAGAAHVDVGAAALAAVDAPPAVPAQGPTAVQLQAPGRVPPPPHTILYIEDNAVNAVLMDAMLARLPGVRLLHAALPQPGLDMAQRETPALVLLDIQLPEMHGFEVLARLRAMPALAHTPVVAVSANAVPADIQAALDLGFAAYLTKPVEMATLLQTVRQWLPA